MMLQTKFLTVDLGSDEYDFVEIHDTDQEEEVFYVQSIFEDGLYGEIYFDQDNFSPAPWLGWEVRK